MTAHAIAEPLSDAWSTAVPDWEDRIVNQRSLIPDLPLFDVEADLALRVFKRLRVPDIIGQPTHGEVCEPWVFDLVRTIFGSFDPQRKRRMIREFFLLIPKKNGKSSIAAAIIVTAAILNRRPEAELLLIAPTKKIAYISFKQAMGIVRLDPELDKIFHLQQHQRTLTHRNTLAVIIIKAADADVITGSKATYILVDETHEFSKKPKATEIFIEIRGSLAARPDGFMVQITTQSKSPPAGLFKSELEIARQVRDGHMRLPLLAILYELPFDLAKDGGWRDPKTWGMVNPNLNVSVDESFLSDEILKADHEGDAKLLLIASQHFNVQIGLAEMNDAWPGARYWLLAGDETLTLETLIERSEVVTIGIDGGGLDDLGGLAVLGRCKITRDWLLWNRAWAHEDVLHRRKEIAATLMDFMKPAPGRKQGDLILCEAPTQDLIEIADICVQVRDAGLLPEKGGIGIDRMGLPGVLEELLSRAFDIDINGGTITGIPQAGWLNPAILGSERRLKDGTMWHAGQPMMAWCVGNAKVEMKTNARSITKQLAGSGKIDPLIASFNAVMLMSRNPEVAGPSVYETRGIRMI